MKYMQLIGIALCAIFAVAIVPSLANTISIPGGTSSSTYEPGATGSGIYQLVSDATLGDATPIGNQIEANIYAYAHTTGTGMAYTETHVPDFTKTIYSALDKKSSLTVYGSGDLTAKVEGKDSIGTEVAAFSQIYANAKYNPGTKTISGSSSIYSLIGKELSGNTLTGVAKGQFTASSYADGSAGYEAKGYNLMSETSPDTSITQTVSGKVTGTTTLEADTTKGTTVSSSSGTTPAVAKLTSLSTAKKTLSGTSDMTYYAANDNLVDVKAIIGAVTPTLEESTVAGTADGSDNAYAGEISSKSTPTYDYRAMEATTSSSAKMSADVSVSDKFDSATATAEINPIATLSGSYAFFTNKIVYDADSRAATFSSVSRGLDDSSVPAFGRSFITSGDWNAEASKTAYTYNGADLDSDDYSASVSGKLGTITGWTNGDGMGGGAFLLTPKNGVSSAANTLTQGAKLTSLTNIFGTTVTASTESDIQAAIQGQALGGDAKDGAGLYAAYRNLKMTDESEEPFAESSAKTISTELPTVNAYLWIDGTSSAPYLGYGLSVPTSPVFTGIAGTYVEPTISYLNSPTQRNTWFTGSTDQNIE